LDELQARLDERDDQRYERRRDDEMFERENNP
jgi:hypothetical protein